jgi:hypothetical protein
MYKCVLFKMQFWHVYTLEDLKAQRAHTNIFFQLEY